VNSKRKGKDGELEQHRHNEKQTALWVAQHGLQFLEDESGNAVQHGLTIPVRDAF